MQGEIAFFKGDLEKSKKLVLSAWDLDFFWECIYIVAFVLNKQKNSELAYQYFQKLKHHHESNNNYIKILTKFIETKEMFPLFDKYLEQYWTQSLGFITLKISTANEVRLIPNEQSFELDKYDLKYNALTKIAVQKKGDVDLSKKPLLSKVLWFFLKNHPKSFSKEQLAKKVWEKKYHPFEDDINITNTIKRLNDLFDSPIIRYQDKTYQVCPQINFALFDESKGKGNKRYQQILNCLTEHETLSADQLAEKFSISKRSIQRDLKGLVDQGKVLKQNKGKQVFYKLA